MSILRTKNLGKEIARRTKSKSSNPLNKPSKKAIRPSPANSYDFGGQVGDLLKGGADAYLGFMGLPDAIKEKDYKTGFGRELSGLNDKAAPFTQMGGNIALNALAPGAGSIYYGGMGMANSSLKSQETPEVTSQPQYSQPKPAYYSKGGITKVTKNGKPYYTDMTQNSKTGLWEDGKGNTYGEAEPIKSTFVKQGNQYFNFNNGNFNPIAQLTYEQAKSAGQPINEYNFGGITIPNGQGSQIEVEGKKKGDISGGELEVSNGKITMDFKGQPAHSEGGITYNAEPNKIIIPNKDRDKYMKSDKFTRATIERRLVSDQRKREQNELVQKAGIYDKMKEGGLIPFDSFHKILPPTEFSSPNFETSQAGTDDYLKPKEFKKGGGIHIKPSHKGRFTAYKARTGKTTAEALHSKDPHVRQMANFARNATKWKHANGGFTNPYGTDVTGLQGPLSPQYMNAGINAGVPQIPTPYTTEGAMNYLSPEMQGSYYDTNIFTTPVKAHMPKMKMGGIPKYYGMEAQPQSLRLPSQKSGYGNFVPQQNKPMNWQQGINTAATLAPVAYNLALGAGKPNVEKPIYNPYENQVKDIMSKRQISLDPLRRDLYAQEKIASQPMGSESQGGYLSRRTQIGANTQRTLADLGVKQQDMNNSYQGEYANTLNQLGSGHQQADMVARGQSIQNLRNKYNLLSTGIGEGSKIAQGINRDNTLKGMLPDLQKYQAWKQMQAMNGRASNLSYDEWSNYQYQGQQ